MIPASPPWTLADLAGLCGARWEGAETKIEAVEAWPAGGAASLVLVESQHEADSVRAAALLCTPGIVTAGPALRSDHPRLAFAALLTALDREPSLGSSVSPEARIEPGVRVGGGAVVERGAWLEADAVVGPCAYVGAGARVGPRCRIGPGAVILEGTVLGPDVQIDAGAVIGSRGFGYVFHDGAHQPIPQIGGVEIGAGSRVGSATCVDRATVGMTSLGARVIVGELSQIAHNVRVDDGTSVGHQVGIAGSCHIESNCAIGNQVGIAPHSVIGTGARLADRAGNTRGVVPPGAHMVGFPARPREEALRTYAAVNRLEWILQRLERLVLDESS
ncbi:MAG: UDP-3-O-(3-hydroxymyristoyl)glucosamine N-acyltransferase [Armatimonadetes bacterium]|nr:UDP-3-O-(3-hydroxymyristoyl)glucosamine N-acyltransferase [Armatimonadota bacterium]